MGNVISEGHLDTAPPGPLCKRKVLLDDEQTRITYFDFGPGEGNEWHAHPYDFVVVTFDDGTLQSTLPDGSTATIAAKENNYYKVPAGNVHHARNVGEKPLRLLEVELKNTDITKFAGASAGSAAQGVPNLADLIRGLEAKRIAAMLAGDVGTLQTLLSDSLSYTHSSGNTDSRDSYLASISSGALRYHQLAVDELAIHPVGTDTVITTGRMKGRIEIGGREKELSTKFTTTWLRAQGFWKLVSFHATPMAH